MLFTTLLTPKYLSFNNGLPIFYTLSEMINFDVSEMSCYLNIFPLRFQLVFIMLHCFFLISIWGMLKSQENFCASQQYGDIRTLYTSCKHRGFVMISYYDIRDSRNAMRSLQNKPLRRRKLDIHFSIPKV